MSAIEVLKRLKENPCGLVDIHEVGMDPQSSWTEANISEELDEALSEAIVALEQKEIAKVRIEELKADIEMLKAENKELIDKLNACENRCYVFESELK